jgi:hypothetical protein
MANGRKRTPDSSRGSGPDKVTQAVDPDLDAPAGAQRNEADGSNEPDPAGGGCLRFGWGCLPVLAVIAALPIHLFF